MKNKFQNLLNEQLTILENASKILQYSYKKVKNIVIKKIAAKMKLIN